MAFWDKFLTFSSPDCDDINPSRNGCPASEEDELENFRRQQRKKNNFIPLSKSNREKTAEQIEKNLKEKNTRGKSTSLNVKMFNPNNSFK
jgi:hypothetical protein